MNIERRIDELTIERWGFYCTQDRIYLDSYCLLKKESKKDKKYRVIKSYDRLRERDSTLKESEVPFNEAIKTEAFNRFVSGVKVLRWSERKI